MTDFETPQQTKPKQQAPQKKTVTASDTDIIETYRETSKAVKLATQVILAAESQDNLTARERKMLAPLARDFGLAFNTVTANEGQHSDKTKQAITNTLNTFSKYGITVKDANLGEEVAILQGALEVMQGKSKTTKKR